MKNSEKEVLHFPVLVEQDENGIYIVSCPVFKGCHSYGKTVEEAVSNIREVIEICLDEEKENADRLNRFIEVREVEIPYNSKT
jgi:predicted RNase H-like HicB family nuclease